MPKSGRTAWQLSRYHQSLYPRKNHVLSVVSLHSLTECVRVCGGGAHACACVCARLCVRTCVCACVCGCTHVHVCVCVCTRLCVCACVCVCVHTSMCVCMRVCVHVHKQGCMPKNACAFEARGLVLSLLCLHFSFFEAGSP